MNVSPIQIRVNLTERRLFEVAAKRSGMTITQLVKQAVLDFAQGTTVEKVDPFIQALEKLEKFEPTAEQTKEHRRVSRGIDDGKRKGLDKKQAAALLNDLQNKK